AVLALGGYLQPRVQLRAFSTGESQIRAHALREVPMGEHPAGNVIGPGAVVVVSQPCVGGGAHHDGADSGDEVVVTHRPDLVDIAAEQPVQRVVAGCGEAVQVGGGVVTVL